MRARQFARILVVEDTLENRDILEAMLEDEGYQVSVAENGREALSLVAKVKPDLILLDVMMPEMDGFETCKRLKASSATQNIPVIFLTARMDPEDIVKGFKLGARDYVTKPFNAVELSERVKTHIQLRLAQQKLEQLADKLAKYLSPQVYASIFSGEKDVKIESSRKIVTVCFTDVVAFMPKAEGMDHHTLTNWLNHYLNEMAEIVIRYGGTLDKYMGDAIMIFFGDPVSQGPRKDALQCVRMAMEMVFHTKKLGIDIRIGINTGECTVGNFGSADRMDYTIIGRPVNIAARLEKQSEPGKILINEATYSLVKDDIWCEPRGPIQVKGSSTKLMTYWAVEPYPSKVKSR